MLTQIINSIKGDKPLWAIVTILGLFSFLPAYSASTNLVYVVGSSSTTMGLFIKHIGLLIFGFIIMYTIHKVPYNYFKLFSIISLPVVFLLLFFTLVFNSSTIAGANASRWMRVGGISFQPSTLASVVLLSYVARYLAKESISKVKRTFKQSLAYLWLPVFLIVALIFPSNFSTAAMLMLMVFIVCLVAKYPIKYLIKVGLGCFLFALLFILVVKAFPRTISNRVDTWTNRVESYFDEDSENSRDYQVEYSKTAIASGGLMGVGAGKSVMKNFLPQSSSDFIYAIIVEEYGLLIGGILLIVFYMYLFFRMVVIINKANDMYGKLLVVAIGFPIIFQAFINMSVAVELLPVTGQTLPLISSGGTSIWMTCLSLGMVLAVSSDNAKRTSKAEKSDGSFKESIEILSEQV